MEVATYVYGLVHSTRKPSLRGVPTGVPGGGRVRVVRADRSLWAIVSTVPIALFGEAAIERGLKDLTWVSACAVGHERVIARFLSRGTVVPMKLFTIFGGDARAVEHVARRRRSIEPLVRRLRNRVELGVRVSLVATARPATPGPVAGGVEYLRAKKTLHAASVELRAHAQARVDEIFDALAAESSESLRRPLVEANAGGGRVLLDAAYLVPVRRTRRFQSAVRALATSLKGEGYVVTLTGPWPAYNFTGDRR